MTCVVAYTTALVCLDINHFGSDPLQGLSEVLTSFYARFTEQDAGFVDSGKGSHLGFAKGLERYR